MNIQKVLFIFLFSTFSFGFKWDTFSIRRTAQPPVKVRAVWVVDTAMEKKLKPQLVNNSPPLITEHIVVQGNSINGIKAYKKDKGQLLWNFKIRSGVASAVALHKGNIYFGGADGFFYSLQLKTGQLNWKFWTGSENSGAPLIHDDRVYWTALNQKMYALTLKGKRLWVYSGPSYPKDFFVRGRPQPAVYQNWIYTGFYRSVLVALNKETGQFQWKKSLSSSHSIIGDLGIRGNCLFVPVFDFYLFCLDPLNKKIHWKARGGSSPVLTGSPVVYQSYKKTLYALRAFDAKVIWKKKIKNIRPPFFISVFGKYLVYGSSSQGQLIVANSKNGKTLSKYRFGRGLAAPVSADLKNNNIYFSSVDG